MGTVSSVINASEAAQSDTSEVAPIIELSAAAQEVRLEHLDSLYQLFAECDRFSHDKGTSLLNEKVRNFALFSESQGLSDEESLQQVLDFLKRKNESGYSPLQQAVGKHAETRPQNNACSALLSRSLSLIDQS